MTDLLDAKLYGGSVQAWALALGVTLIIVLAYRLVVPRLVDRLDVAAKRTHSRLDDAVVAALRSIKTLLVLVLAASAGSGFLTLPPHGVKVVAGAATVALFLQLGISGGTLLRFWIANSRTRALASNAGAATSISALGLVAEIVLWAVLVLVVLDNLGVNVTTLVAGLGVGGIAVALAVQNILGDLFASLSIVVDKPFVIGDFIIVDDYMGTVENVGLKTTRIRSLGGEQIIFSNSDLLKTRVRNYKRMYERRVQFNVLVAYDTPPEKVERLPATLRTIVEAQAKVRVERVHFARLGATALELEIAYWVLDPDYGLYMDIQQAINLSILRACAKEGIEFALPPMSAPKEQPGPQPGDGVEPPPPSQREVRPTGH